MVGVRLENLCKYFGDVKAVDNVNLSLGDGEFFALLGPSGCGKTTTMLTIAGIYKPTSGNVYFDEKIVNDLPPKDRNVGMVFQSYALYPHMKIFDNIAFPLKLKRMQSDEITRRVKKIAEFVGISELLDRKPGELSGGQQQRAALARALVKEPSLFLMDEPLSNLDAKLRVTMRGELKRLQKDLGITTVYVTHDQVEAMTMSDRVAIMDRGRVMQVGSATELYNKPENMFVAGFIGSPPMNFIDCLTEERDGMLHLNAGAFTIDIPRDVEMTLRERALTSEVVLGIRPEDVSIQQKGLLKGIDAEIYLVEPLGREVLVTLRVGDVPLRALTDRIWTDIGGKVRINFNMQRIHIFDRKTTRILV